MSHQRLPCPSQNWPAGWSHPLPPVILKLQEKGDLNTLKRHCAVPSPPPFRTLAKHPSALFLQIRLFWAFHPIKYLSPMFLALLLHMLFSKFLNVEHVVGSISFSGLGPYSPYAYVAIYPFTLLLMRHWPFPFWHFCQVLYEYIHACTCFKTCF